jgi:hypothetical protein
MHTHKGVLVHRVLSLNLAFNLTQTSGLFCTQGELVSSLKDPQLDIAPCRGVD